MRTYFFRKSTLLLLYPNIPRHELLSLCEETSESAAAVPKVEIEQYVDQEEDCDELAHDNLGPICWITEEAQLR